MSVVQSTDYSLQLDWFVPGILRHFDVPDLSAAVYPRPVWIADAVDALGTTLPAHDVRQCYAQRVPDNSAVMEKLKVINTSGQYLEVYRDWLRDS